LGTFFTTSVRIRGPLWKIHARDSESESLNLSGHMQEPPQLGNPDQWSKDVRLKVETPVAKEQAIFQVRATPAVQHLLATLDSSVLVEAASAPTDTEELLSALQQPSVLSSLLKQDPLGEAKLRGQPGTSTRPI
jgi:hypothetical protein